MSPERRAAWLPKALAALLFCAGWIGAQIVGPGARLTRLEAQQARLDSTLTTHISWGLEQRDKLMGYVESLARLKCMETYSDPGGRQLLQAAQVPCDRLLGNNLPSVGWGRP